MFCRGAITFPSLGSTVMRTEVCAWKLITQIEEEYFLPYCKSNIESMLVSPPKKMVPDMDFNELVADKQKELKKCGQKEGIIVTC